MSTPHALDRYREHHPGAELDDMLEAVEQARRHPIAPELAILLSGRRYNRTGKYDSSYFATADHRGLFVFDGNRQLVTYLRLSAQAHAVLAGPGDAETPPVQQIHHPRCFIPASIVGLTNTALFGQTLKLARRLFNDRTICDVARDPGHDRDTHHVLMRELLVGGTARRRNDTFTFPTGATLTRNKRSVIVGNQEVE